MIPSINQLFQKLTRLSPANITLENQLSSIITVLATKAGVTFQGPVTVSQSLHLIPKSKWTPQTNVKNFWIPYFWFLDVDPNLSRRAFGKKVKETSHVVSEKMIDFFYACSQDPKKNKIIRYLLTKEILANSAQNNLHISKKVYGVALFGSLFVTGGFNLIFTPPMYANSFIFVVTFLAICALHWHQVKIDFDLENYKRAVEINPKTRTAGIQLHQYLENYEKVGGITMRMHGEAEPKAIIKAIESTFDRATKKDK